MSNCADSYHGARNPFVNKKCADCSTEIDINDGFINFKPIMSREKAYICSNCFDKFKAGSIKKRCVRCGTSNNVKNVVYGSVGDKNPNNGGKACDPCWDILKS